MSLANGTYTPTEKRMLKLLSDGLPHKRQELHSCLEDELSQLDAIQPHLSRIRHRIRAVGEDIICVLHQRTIAYQHVRTLCSPYDGRS